MEVFGVLLAIACLLAAIAVVLAVAAFIQVREVVAKMTMLEKAPVLKQVVQEFIPIDNSEEAQKVIKQRQHEMEQEFEKQMGVVVGGFGKRNPRAESNILRAEELV